MNKKKTKNKVKNYLLSSTTKKIVSISLLLLGLILITSTALFDLSNEDQILGLGVSIVVGTSIGSLAGYKGIWPLGFCLGLFGGLILSPIFSFYIGSGASAYYSSFFGLIFGALIGGWYDLNNKNLEQTI